MKFLYVANCGLPDTAAGLRIYYIATMLRKLGHSVDFLCGIYNNKETIEFDGFTYFFDTNNSFFLKGVNMLFGTTIKRRLKKYFFNYHYDSIIIYNDVNGISKYAKKLGIRFYSDVTEWYSFSIKNGISDNAAAFKASFRILKIDKYSSGIIAISQFLFDYYQKKGINVVRIPPIVKMHNQLIIDEHSGINLIYSGSPRNKDFLLKVINALIIINRQCTKFNLFLIGISEKEYMKKYRQNKIPSFIKIVGRIPHNEVASFYALSDFSVLMRKKRRYAKAGYSTKFAESLSCGVPVICNRVGGADLDIIDGYNGFTLKAMYTVNDICKVLEMISTLDKQKIEKMRYNSFEYAKKKYDQTNYYENLSRLIEVKS